MGGAMANFDTTQLAAELKEILNDSFSDAVEGAHDDVLLFFTRISDLSARAAVEGDTEALAELKDSLRTLAEANRVNLRQEAAEAFMRGIGAVTRTLVSVVGAAV